MAYLNYYLKDWETVCIKNNKQIQHSSGFLKEVMMQRASAQGK